MYRHTVRSPFELFNNQWLRGFGFPAVVTVGTARPGVAPKASACCAPGSDCGTPSANATSSAPSVGAKSTPPSLRLALDIGECEQSIVITASLPGFAKDEVQVEVDDGVLSISAQRHTGASSEGATPEVTWHSRERRQVNWSRSVRLPDGVNGDGVTAELKDGVLTIIVPRPTKEALSGRKIQIN